MMNQKGVPTCQSPQEITVLENELEKIIKEGDLAEVGVYMGGTAKVMAEICPDRQIYIFDTFEGLPETDESKGDCITVPQYPGDMKEATYEKCQGYLYDYKNIHIYKGIFPGTSEPIKNKKFAFIHIDTDTYNSIKDCLEFFFPRMLPGSIIVVHDYQHYVGVTRAVDEFLKEHTLTVERHAQRQGIIRL